jgi:Photosynthetic reaction centre cytochrome C subunit
MNARVIAALILGGSVFAVAALGAALQGPDKKTPEGSSSAHLPAHPKPTNLKVLPKEISGDDVDKLMHQYEQYLGVPCGYCHEENPETKQIDYASDENPVKETARFMISMTSDINDKYLSRFGDRRYAAPITCGNCHRGQVQPPSFELKSHP